jgi:alcohol-forming fatty acyl-CoA reductase
MIEAIPVDTCINSIIVMVKHIASNPRSQEIPIYNITLHESRKISNGKMFKVARDLSRNYPCTAGLWYPDGSITTNILIHTLKVIFFQWIPAYFIDFIFLIFGQKRL